MAWLGLDPGDPVPSNKSSVEGEKSNGTDDKMDESSHDEMMEGTRTRRVRATSQAGGDSDTQEEAIDRQLMAQKMKDDMFQDSAWAHAERSTAFVCFSS